MDETELQVWSQLTQDQQNELMRDVYWGGAATAPPKKKSRWHTAWRQARHWLADRVQSLAIKIGGEDYDCWY